VDGSGNVFVAGDSNANWGTPIHAYTYGYYDAFIARLNSNGTLVWNTFLGSNDNDEAHAIAVDGSDNVFVTGVSNISWGTPLRSFTSSDCDAFVARLNSSGTFVWNTFLGGGDNDEGHGIATDSSGNVFVTGFSYAAWGTPVRAYTGYKDAFAARLNPSGVLQSNAFLGGDEHDYGQSIVVDSGGNSYIAGGSGSTWGSPVRTFSNYEDAFIAKVNLPVPPPAAATLVYPLVTSPTHTPTYIWSKVTGATLYRLWVKNSLGTWIIQSLYNGTNICGVTNCAVTPGTSLDNGVYTWYIQTLTATQNGSWATHSFTVSAPGKVTMVAPKGTIHIAKPTFIWSKDTVATLYRLWVKNSSGTWVIQKLYAGKNICGATNCAIVSPNSFTNGAYTWYIQTLTATQNGQWSGQSITISVPDVVPSLSGSETGVMK
jgi:hypothetical protein